MQKISKTQSARVNSELLSTKLTPPRLHGPLVEREALFGRLDAGMEQRVILLSAPAGSGKTTLVRAWLASREGNAKMPPAAWVSLDANDNDPLRFWRYVLTACQAFQGHPGQQALEVLLSAQQQTPFESALTVFINELASMDGRGILVLEDYHNITAQRVHETLAFLLDYLPETLRVVLITRADPPLPLPRWRAHHDLSELRAADLRFSAQETRAFLQQAFPFPLAPDTLTRLDERVEGWAAGLRLLALALQGRQDAREIEQALATSSGSHQHILEYLIADVLHAQPEPLQLFLLQTSLLARLNGPLCDSLTDRQDSAQVLTQLDQANLFVYPLDGAGQWYRYHALFAEAMQHEARRRLGEERCRELYRKASQWYEAQDQPIEAIDTAFAAHDFTRAADLMEHLADPHIFQSDFYTLLRFAEQLPEEQLQTHPGLCIIYATALLYLTDRRSPVTLARMERPLQIAERHWQAENNPAGLGEIEALRAAAAWWQGDFAQTFARSRRALELLSTESLVWRGTCLLHLSVAEQFAGRLDQARQLCMEAFLANQAAGNPFAARATQFVLCEICFQRGELRLAAQLYHQLFTEAGAVQDITDVGAACGGLARLAYEWNNLETVHEGATQMLETARRFSDDDLLARASLILVGTLHLQGQTEQAVQDLTTLTAQMQRWPHLLHDIHACHARLALLSGDLATAQQQIASCANYSDESNFTHQEALARLNARQLIAQDRTDEALKLLLTWQAETQERGFIHSLLEILILQSLAHHARKEISQARQALRQALTLARPEGYQRLFLDEGPAMGELLRSILPEMREEPLHTYTRELLHTFAREHAAEQSSSPAPSAEPILIEPLSPQERRVLRLLAAGRSNPEIANELVVSVNTIKTQVQSIYYKLGVNSRQEAREAARKLKLM